MKSVYVVVPVNKHLAGQHDQSTHGSWADNITHEISAWNPLDPIPPSPRNGGGFTARAQYAWEHGPDGTQFVELFRKYACQILGLPVPETPYDKGGYLEYMLERGWGAPNRNEVKGLLKAIANSKPQPVLWRGLQSDDTTGLKQDFTQLEAGDVIDMPLVSTTRSQGAAEWYATGRGNGNNSVLIKIQAGAKGWAFKDAMFQQDAEVITSGKFEVVGVTKVKHPFWARFPAGARMRQHVDANGNVDETWYQMWDYGANVIEGVPKEQYQAKAKTFYESLVSGDLSSFESPDVKFVFDRGAGQDRWGDYNVTLWAKQPDKEFTVVEVKMIEPHVVSDEIAKSKSQDLGNKFYWLFNDRPFIQENLVQKHLAGQHDQSSHGDWAHSNDRSPKEQEIQQRISNVKVILPNKNETNDFINSVTAEYSSPSGQTIYLMQDNYFRSSDGGIDMETQAYVAFSGGKRQIGYLNASHNTNFPDASIENVFVEPKFQRQGVATAMLNLARSYAPNGIKIEHSFSLTRDAEGWAGVVKHLAGQHDQSSHGNWADGDGSNEISIQQLASIINANKPYDSLDVWRKTLQDVLKATGKTGKPTFGDTSQGMEFWRTFQQGSAFDLETSDNIRLSAKDKIKQFMASKLPYISMGRNGIGLYGAHTKKEAEIWGYKGDEKQIVKMAFKPNAKILTIPSSEANWVLANSGLLESQISLLRHTALTDFSTSWFFTDKLTTRNLMALAMGYDAINDSPMLYDPADRSLPDREMVVLNAGALIVQNPDAVSKHLQGQHDQSTHGNWAGAESFKSASLNDLPALDLSRLDSTTMDARNNYVGFGYSWMNDYLRSGNIDDTVRIIYNEQIPKEQGIAQIDSLKNALYETETTQDLTVTRWSSGASLFRQQVSTMSEEDINGLVGKTFEAKGFTSTSAPNSVHQSVNDSFKASATVFSNIHMPAGTHGATMGNDEEGEFVIAPNTTFVVMGAKRLDKTRIVLDLLVTGQENG